MKISYIGFSKLGWLEKRHFSQIMFKWLEDQLNALGDNDRVRVTRNLNNFEIRFFPTTMYKDMYGEYNWRSSDTGNLSDLIPHEIVGQNKIDLFVLDDKSDMMMASNIIMMSHGLGHALLYSYDPSRRMELKYDDASGNKKGTILNWHTAAVHNRTEAISKTVQRINDPEIDNQIYYMETYKPINKLWRKVIYRMYDFRDDLR